MDRSATFKGESMIYDQLARYYDALVGDDEACRMWEEFVKKHVKPCKMLELACGSGEITNALHQDGYDILATDISEAMINELNKKYPYIKTQILDMNNFKMDEKYDSVICFCDSINYLMDYHQMVDSVYDVLNDHGIFMFDMHTLDRIKEFEDEYIEEGYLDDIPYQWTITSYFNQIHQHFAFYCDNSVLQEQHVQYVFDSNEVIDYLKQKGFKVKVYTDFVLDGIQNGEKIFIVGEKIC